MSGMTDTLPCSSCGVRFPWTPPFYQTIPGRCPACGVAIRLRGAASGCNLIVASGPPDGVDSSTSSRVVEVLWYEYGPESLTDAVRADLASFDGSVPEGVYDLGEVTSQGNGHYGASVVVVPLADRERGARERADRAAREAALLPVAVELVTAMWGRPARGISPHDRVDCVHPQEGGKVDDAYMAEYHRRAAVTRGWLEALLGEPVGADAGILDVAERWLMWDRPRAAPCDWGGTDPPPELSRAHLWIARKEDDGPLGVNDHWRCSGCGARGGPAWSYEGDGRTIAGKVVFALPPGFPAFHVGVGPYPHHVGDDCHEAQRRIAAFEVEAAREPVDPSTLPVEDPRRQAFEDE